MEIEVAVGVVEFVGMLLVDCDDDDDAAADDDDRIACGRVNFFFFTLIVLGFNIRNKFNFVLVNGGGSLGRCDNSNGRIVQRFPATTTSLRRFVVVVIP